MEVQVKEFRDPYVKLIDCLNEITNPGGRIITHEEILEPHWCGLDEEHAGWKVIYKPAENVSASNKFWIAKDGGTYIKGTEMPIGVYADKPTLEDDMPFFKGKLLAEIPAELLPEITFENSPKQIKIEILDGNNT
jgi:hypothetical protein